MDDFDRRQDREEDREEQQFAAKMVLQELSRFKMQRCCVFPSESEEVFHGQLTGVLGEMSALVVKDRRPGRETSGARQIVPYDSIEHMCVVEKLDACKTCHVYKQLKEMADAPEPKKAVPEPGAAPSDSEVDAVGAEG